MTGEQASPHIPVLLTETLDLLVTDKAGRYVDCTLGMGGHTGAILQALSPAGKVLALDADPEAAAIAGQRLKAYQNLTIVRTNFRNVGEVVDERGFAPLTGALMDLGLSSYQLDKGTRGLSFSTDAPLDMRIDPEGDLTAADVVNYWGEQELSDLFEECGERNARGVARALVFHRQEKPFTSTKELADVLARQGRKGRLNPATIVFMALRIAVNKEIPTLEAALGAFKTRLSPRGRLAVISFHSLEDRAVKLAFRAWKQEGGWDILTPKPLTPSAEETSHNPRARSAKLRVIERLQPRTSTAEGN